MIKILFVTAYSPMFPNMRSLIKKTYLSGILINLKKIFLENSICTVFKRNINIEKILSPSLSAKNKNEKK